MNRMASFLAGVTFLAVCASACAAPSDLDAWLHAPLYGSDNQDAALRKVTLRAVDGGYKVRVDNQFAFECGLDFSAAGTPLALRQCKSTLKPGDAWYQAGQVWRVKEGVVALQCTNAKKEVVCRGDYTLEVADEGRPFHALGGGASRDYFTIARKLK